ncbi:MAG: hypothetical protein JW791_00245 [Nanoarchaeota archaeon]|nr:hypothetical protein [Nanoarchaeota archaeon]
MKLTKLEKKLMVKRLNQLKTYLVQCLENNQLHNYFNTLNSREFKALEQKLYMHDYSWSHSLHS